MGRASVVTVFVATIAVGLASCGQNNSSQNDDNPSSTDNLLVQTTLQALQEASQSADVEVGITAPPEVVSNAQALTAACDSVTTVPSSLDPNDLPANYSVTWNFNDCVITTNALESGSRSVDASRDRTDKTRTLSTTRDVTMDGFDGSQMTVQGNDTMTATGLRRDGSISRTDTSQSTRIRVDGDGTTAYHVQATYSTNIADTYVALRLTERVVDGSGVLQHVLDGAQSSVSLQNLTYTPSCCYPLSGTMVQTTTTKKGVTTRKTYTFSSTCGHLRVNDRTNVVYPACGR